MVSITTDDFGYSHKANIEIIKLAKNGKIDRISLLVNFPKAGEAVGLYNQKHLAKKVPIGLHFNMIEGKNFDPLPIFLLKILFKKITKVQIQQELELQIKAFKKLGFYLEHLNSHQNIHLFAPIDEIFYEIAKKHKIKFIRSKNSVIRRLKQFPLKLISFYLYSFLNKLVYHSRNPFNKTFPTIEEIIIHPGTNFDKKPI